MEQDSQGATDTTVYPLGSACAGSKAVTGVGGVVKYSDLLPSQVPRHEGLLSVETPPSSSFRRWIRISDDEALLMRRWTSRVLGVFIVLTLLLAPFIRSGYFRTQFHLKQARGLIEHGGYAYCAIWGDGADPFQLMPMNSPMKPRWEGIVRNDGTYLMVFTYRRSGRVYEHRWMVDLQTKQVTPVTPEGNTPYSDGRGNMQCREG